VDVIEKGSKALVDSINQIQAMNLEIEDQ